MNETPEDQQRLFRDLMQLVDEAKAAAVVDSRPLKVITDELWGEDLEPSAADPSPEG